MCNMSAYVEDRATLKAATKMMNNLSLSFEQVLDALEIEEYDCLWFIDHLEDEED